MDQRQVYRRLVIAVAIAFLLSAWLYCLATLHIGRGVTLGGASSASALMQTFQDHGAKILLVELALLAACATGMVRAERSVKRNVDAGPDTDGLTEDQQQDQTSAEHDDDRDNQHG